MVRTTKQILTEGSLGFFWEVESWPPSLSDDDVERGWVQLDGRSIALRLLDEHHSFGGALGVDDLVRPDAVVGVLPDDGVLVLDCGWRRGTRVFGGERASTARIDGRAVVGKISPSELRGPGLYEVSASFPGLQRWAGVSSLNEAYKAESGITRKWSIETVHVDPISTKIQSLVLTLSADWSVVHQDERSVIEAPLRISCGAKRARPVSELVDPLWHVQDLVSLAFGGLVTAADGRCTPHLANSERPSQTPTFWSGALHGEREPHLQVPRPRSDPLFGLATVGGVSGLSRWVRLCQKHHRAVAPTVQHLRSGPPTATSLIREVAAAIEYWAKINRRKSWFVAGDFTGTMISRAGSAAWQDWCGNNEEWKKAFWDSYNLLKHSPNYNWDDQEVADLALSGRLLLTLALLNHVAGSHAPSRTLLRNHEFSDLGRRLRNRYKP